MTETLKASIDANLLSSGLPALDHTTFKKQHFNFPNGVRAILTKGKMDLNISGTIQTKDVVLKTINGRFADRSSAERTEKLLQYFDREAGIWRHTVSHPNILELYGYMTVPGETFPSLVSPYYPEGNLRAYVEERTNHALPAKQRIKLTCDIARGLDFLHNLSPVIVHRDIRASNALVRNEEGVLSAVIIDFGSAKLSDPELFKILNSTHVSAIAWSPPEYVMHPDKYASPTTYGDVWSLACTCLEIFTAMDPYPDWCDIDDSLTNGEPPERPPKELVDIDDLLWSFLERCWDQSPELRPSASDVVLELEKTLLYT